MRCEWCGIQAHAACYIILIHECTFGRLRDMMLPPNCVCLHTRNFSKMHCFRISESLQTEQDEDHEVDGITQGSVKEMQISADSSKQSLKIYDGHDAVKRNQPRIISVPRIAKNEEVVEASLRAYYIPDDPRDYELQTLTPQTLACEDIINRNGTTDDDKAGSVFKEVIPEAWIIRAKPKDRDVLKIYLGWMKVGVAYISIPINNENTVQTVVQEILLQLGRQKESLEDFRLVEVVMGSKQVQRTILPDKDCIIDRLNDIRKASLREMNQTRIYIEENTKSDIKINILIVGLPLLLSGEEYTDILKDNLDIKTNLLSVVLTYSSHGAVVLEISCFSEAERIFMLLKDTAVNNKQLTGVIIPHIMQDKLPQSSCPLLVFVNPKSGGLKGRDLLYSFRKLLNPHQVFDLTNGGPLPGFHTFSQVSYFRVLVCGGDGTVGWVLGALEEIRYKLVCTEPSVAVLPLGTGNDLGRVLRWGTGYSGEDPYAILISVDEAENVLMDRWTILLDAQEVVDAMENGISEPEPPKIVQMNNYCGIGIDAELSLDFHHAREVPQ
ncbi:hypothetical protein FKM82_018659 [Ascaphus truei]